MTWKHLILTTVMLTFGLQSLFAIDMLFSYSRFQTPNSDPYVETYIAIPSSSLKLVDGENGKKAAVEVTIIISRGEEVVAFDKYVLNSPVLNDSISTNLLDVKRFPLKPGDYNVEIKYNDVNNPTDAKDYKEDFTIGSDNENICISDISLLDAVKKAEAENDFVKNGLELSPYVFPYYTDKFTSLKFYCEVYNANQLEDSTFLIQYYVVPNGQIEITNGLRRFKKEKVSAVNIVMGEFDVADLESGNYKLIVDVRNKKNEILAQKNIVFHRNNSLKKAMADNEEYLSSINTDDSFVTGFSLEELEYHIGSIEPIVDANQITVIKNLLEEKDVKLMRSYLFNFWQVTNPADPETGFNQYKNVVDGLDKEYGTRIKKGHETWRGYVFLKYGKPSQVIAQGKFDPGALPYEIWQYYSLPNGQTNVKFVFYNRDPGANDMDLIHSDARNEISNPQWEQIIYSKVNEGERQGSRTGDF